MPYGWGRRFFWRGCVAGKYTGGVNLKIPVFCNKTAAVAPESKKGPSAGF